MRGRRRPVTLTAGLVATVVALVVVATVVIGVVATLATRAYLLDRLDADVGASLLRVSGPPREGPATPPPDSGGPDGHGSDDFRGAGIGTLTLFSTPSGSDAEVLVQGDDGAVAGRALDAEAVAVLQAVPTDAVPRDVDVPGLGRYRVAAVDLADSGSAASGLPLRGVDDVVGRLVAWELALAAAGALLALAAGTVLVRRQLRPLHEVGR